MKYSLIYSCISSFNHHTENDIDGESLLMLIDDFDEFRCLVEAPLARLKMKKFVKERAGNTSTTEKSQSSKVYAMPCIATEKYINTEV